MLGIRIVEGEIEVEELWCAPEAFLINSLMEVMPLVEVDGRAISDGKPGPVTCRLMMHIEGWWRISKQNW